MIIFISLLALFSRRFLAEVPIGSLHGHLNLDELNSWVANYVLKEYSNIVIQNEIGKSVQGRPLQTLCIGESCFQQNSITDSHHENVIGEAFFNSLHHAREPLGMMALVYFIDDLLIKWKSGDLTTRHLLKRRKLIFLLVVNPDGYIANQKDPGMRRKNFGSLIPGKTCLRRDEEVGVDLNRNYEFCFNMDFEGSSRDPCAIDYGGP